jgi:predicted nucleic acid-binding protein
MGKTYLIDTNSIIDYLDNKLSKKANDLIDSITPKISVISRIELLGWPGASEAQTKVLEDFISNSEVYSLDEPVIIKTIQENIQNKTARCHYCCYSHRQQTCNYHA